MVAACRYLESHMPLPRLRILSQLVVIGLLAGMSAGCMTTKRSADTSASVHELSKAPRTPADLVPVIRYGRYTLVELIPEMPQRDLLQQVIDVSIPAGATASVGDAMRHALLHSGYRLCEVSAETTSLFALPLPAAHLRLGPLILRDALLTLAGPAWELSVDDASREVCFVRRREQQQVSGQWRRRIPFQ